MKRVLNTVTFDHGFHFSTKGGVYTGVTAISLEDFVSKLEFVDAESLLFHYPRGDFQKWVDDTIGDTKLADRLCFIERGLSGEQLRKQLLKIVRNRINELKGPFLSQSTS